ncbi:hypothetical protein TRIUR3_24133 [Triticum urartu]|uniref:Uncharacterized protein n=1 Tax=Triticum urartu TaxID=4572 RepID=M7Z4E9_TRIUA|nr:hypothetical protein TRIUR3_24133 [Triticum urartu]
MRKGKLSVRFPLLEEFADSREQPDRVPLVVVANNGARVDVPAGMFEHTKASLTTLGVEGDVAVLPQHDRVRREHSKEVELCKDGEAKDWEYIYMMMDCKKMGYRIDWLKKKNNNQTTLWGGGPMDAWRGIVGKISKRFFLRVFFI